MTITETTTVSHIVTTVPSSVRVFQRLGVDFCCGGRRPLAAVCAEQGLSLIDVTAAIEASAAQQDAGDADWTSVSQGALIDHIVATYHDGLREELPRLVAWAAKVASVHGHKARELAKVAEIVLDLSADLHDHMQKEERVLFPAIRACRQDNDEHARLISTPIAVLEREHDRAGELLAELRRLTQGYVPHEWGCETLRALYRGLAEMEAAMHVHVHLENNVLFPRALNLDDPLGSQQ